MSQLQSANSQISTALAKSMHDHWGVFLAEGIILVLLGIAAMSFRSSQDSLRPSSSAGCSSSPACSASSRRFARGTRQASAGRWHRRLAAVIAGGLLLWNPLQGLVTLTFVLTAFFIVDGIFMIILAITPSPRAVRQMGMDADQWPHRSDPRRHHPLRPAGHDSSGRSACLSASISYSAAWPWSRWPWRRARARPTPVSSERDGGKQYARYN